jgi:hypothetical protein
VNNTNRRLLVCLAAGASVACASVHAEDRFELRIAEAQQGSNRITLELTYRGADAASLYKASLPWENRYAIVLVAADASPHGSTLKKELLIDDPDSGKVAIASTQTLNGSIDLTDWFPELPDRRSKGDILLFWSYEPKSVKGAKYQRISGVLTLPQQASAQK